jgi:NAD(P)-dependent dehydrogenase (short-subunit alcohol dehydrogenase family)
MSKIRFQAEDLELFSAASHDRNPLHLSASYARRTPFAQPVVQGVLAALATLSVAPAREGVLLDSASFLFRKPVFAGIDYTVAVAARQPLEVRCSLADSGRTLLTANFKFRAGEPLPPGDFSAIDPEPAEADRRVPAELVPGLALDFRYAPCPDALRRLLARWGLERQGLGLGEIAALLCCSYIVGMKLPGERALFSQLKIQFPPRPFGLERGLNIHAEVSEFDDRFQRLGVRATIGPTASPGAEADLSAYVRNEPPTTSVVELARWLPPSASLAGRTAIVIGGSRGFGAAIAVALASQGARVLLNYRSSHDAAAGLQSLVREAGFPGAIELHPGDAADPAWCAAWQAQLATDGIAVDLLICSAAPPIRSVGLSTDGVDRIREYVDQCFALACAPIGAFRDTLRQTGGRLVVVSSVVADPVYQDFPEDWFHYIAAKCAIEGFVRAVAHQSPELPILVVRPPRLLTDQTNTPGLNAEVTPAEQAAAGLVAHLLGPAPAGLEIAEIPRPAKH